MAYTLWSQDIFSKGELSPLMYARVSVNEYNNGLKTAQNTLTYPSGAVGKRFGTLYQATLAGLTSFDQLYFETFQYLNESVYQIVITPGNIYIYLEGILVATVGNSLTAPQVFNAINTVLGSIFRITGAGFKPLDLTRSANSPVAISTFSGNQLVLGSSALTPNLVLPVKFTTSSALPTTTPQIYAGITYFIFANSATNFTIYNTAYDAKFNLNPILITNAGVSSNLVVQNTWTLTNTTFKNLPVYDFNGSVTSYDGNGFSASAVSGGAVTITVSPPYSLLSSAYVGGAFFMSGGSARITAVASTTSFTVAVQTPFDVASTFIPGSQVLLAEPAWSDTRGWPQVCSSYQNRALFANTTSLPNGFWASTINDYSDFGDLTTDDDDAIAWYPTSDNMNYIRFIVPYRSITVHTNTGIYSSPLSDIAAITPSNFTLQLQDSTPADVLQPQAIDNQILVLSGNDAHQMLWDGINNAYTSNVVSVINEQTIRDPQDEAPFAPLHRAGSRFIFIVNANGSLAVFQTLLSQGVSGFVPQIMEQSYGNASFLQVASSSDGRCWFVVQRELAVAGSPAAISGFGGPGYTQLVVSNTLSTTSPTAITFTTTGTLPSGTPAINITDYFWAIAITGNAIVVYLSQEDALAGVNAIVWSSAGTMSNIVPWPPTTTFILEELSNNVFLDCAVQYAGSPTSVVTTGALFNAQDVKMIGDGFGFVSPGEINVNNQIVFDAHGAAVDVSEAFIGFPINTVIEPMPLNIASGPSAKESTLTKPKRIMFVRFMFNNTIGGTINGVPIALAPFSQAHIGEPPFPERGIFEMSIMKGWDDFNNPTFTIEHDEPFDIQLLGVFYSVEI